MTWRESLPKTNPPHPHQVSASLSNNMKRGPWRINPVPSPEVTVQGPLQKDLSAPIYSKGRG